MRDSFRPAETLLARTRTKVSSHRVPSQPPGSGAGQESRTVTAPRGPVVTLLPTIAITGPMVSAAPARARPPAPVSPLGETLPPGGPGKPNGGGGWIGGRQQVLDKGDRAARATRDVACLIRGGSPEPGRGVVRDRDLEAGRCERGRRTRRDQVRRRTVRGGSGRTAGRSRWPGRCLGPSGCCRSQASRAPCRLGPAKPAERCRA